MPSGQGDCLGLLVWPAPGQVGEVLFDCVSIGCGCSLEGIALYLECGLFIPV